MSRTWKPAGAATAPTPAATAAATAARSLSERRPTRGRRCTSGPSKLSSPGVDPIALVASTRLFKTVPADRLETLRPHLKTQAYTRGAYIFHEGDLGHRLFVIEAGEVKISRLRKVGEEAVFSILVAGDVFGELALFDSDSARTADAQAIEPTQCLTLPREPFIDFLRSQPDLL